MAIPLIPTIITAVTSLGLAAMELFSRRKTEHAAQTAQPENPGMMQLAEALQKRMNALEESDVEQARLISELSKNVHKLAEALQSDVQERTKRDAKKLRLMAVLSILSATSLAMSLWAIGH